MKQKSNLPWSSLSSEDRIKQYGLVYLFLVSLYKENLEKEITFFYKNCLSIIGFYGNVKFTPSPPHFPFLDRVNHRQNIFIPHFSSRVHLFHPFLRILDINLARISSKWSIKVTYLQALSWALRTESSNGSVHLFLVSRYKENMVQSDFIQVYHRVFQIYK